MDERVVKFRVGVMVISTLFIAGILILLFGDARSLVRSSYTVYIHFTDAPGVTEGTPIRKSGILIGRVTKVSFADQGGVNVTCKIDGEVKLYRTEVPQVSGSLLGGDVVIQFVRDSKPPAVKAVPVTEEGGVPPPAGEQTVAQKKPVAPMAADNPQDLIKDDDWIEGSVAPNAFQVISSLEGDMSGAISSLSYAGDEVGKLANYFNRMLEGNDEQVSRVITKMEGTLDNLQRLLANADDVIGDKATRDSVKQTIEDLPQTLKDMRTAVNSFQETMNTVDRNMRNLEGFTGPLGEKGEQMVARADQSVARLDEVLTQLSDFSRQLNSGEGSLGRLMRSDDLYNHISSAAKNIDNLTRELKPIVNDARVFTDKISRHPELLGVRGAIQKNSGTKYAPERANVPIWRESY